MPSYLYLPQLRSDVGLEEVNINRTVSGLALCLPSTSVLSVFIELYTVIQKNRPPPTSWLSIVKYSVRVMSRHFTVMYVQLIWYSKSLSVLNECQACLIDWAQACQRYQCCAPSLLFVVGRYLSFVWSSQSHQSFESIVSVKSTTTFSRGIRK